MKKHYLSLLLAGFLVISGCETLGGGSSDSGFTVLRMETQNKQIFKLIFKNEIGDRIYFETDKYNISSASAYVLEKSS